MLFSEAFAQAATETAAQPSMLQSLLPFVLVFFVFYFLIIRPQKKKMVEEQSFNSTLDKGVEVYTKFGLLGTITGLTDKIVTLEVAEGTKVKVLRSQIAGLAQKLFEQPAASAKNKLVAAKK
jgi:preprotein translocase subunit YajC